MDWDPNVFLWDSQTAPPFTYASGPSQTPVSLPSEQQLSLTSSVSAPAPLSIGYNPLEYNGTFDAAFQTTPNFLPDVNFSHSSLGNCPIARNANFTTDMLLEDSQSDADGRLTQASISEDRRAIDALVNNHNHDTNSPLQLSTVLGAADFSPRNEITDVHSPSSSTPSTSSAFPDSISQPIYSRSNTPLRTPPPAPERDSGTIPPASPPASTQPQPTLETPDSRQSQKTPTQPFLSSLLPASSEYVWLFFSFFQIFC
jgi:hypothetical protein